MKYQKYKYTAWFLHILCIPSCRLKHVYGLMADQPLMHCVVLSDPGLRSRELKEGEPVERALKGQKIQSLDHIQKNPSEIFFHRSLKTKYDFCLYGYEMGKNHRVHHWINRKFSPKNHVFYHHRFWLGQLPMIQWTKIPTVRGAIAPARRARNVPW